MVGSPGALSGLTSRCVCRFLPWTLPRLLILSAWIHHLSNICILDLSVQQELLYWPCLWLLTAGTPRSSCSAHAGKPHRVWKHLGKSKCTLHVITPCRMCLMHGNVRYRVCPGLCTAHAGNAASHWKGCITAACIGKFQLETSQALSSPHFPQVAKVHINAGPPTSGMTTARVTDNIYPFFLLFLKWSDNVKNSIICPFAYRWSFSNCWR